MSTETCGHCGQDESPWVLCEHCKKHICADCGGGNCPKRETVDHPSHYGGADNRYEAIKVIDDWGLGFSLGNAVKYILRAKHKGNELQDLKKAQWYLNHEADRRIGILERLGRFFTHLKPRVLHPNDVTRAWQLGPAAADVLRRIYKRERASVIALLFADYVRRKESAAQWR